MGAERFRVVKCVTPVDCILLFVGLFSYIVFSAVHGEEPPLNVIRKFVHLLDMSDIDYEEEIGA